MNMLSENQKIEITEKESCYLAKEYSKIDFDLPSMRNFLSELFETIKDNIPINSETSFLDIGCGRGYFLRYLKEQGIKKLTGIDPCSALLENKLFNNITPGGFEDNPFKDEEFDVVFTCHALHHLKDVNPVYAVKEMFRIAKKYVVIVEINNTNLPMLLVSLLTIKVERNAFRYNGAKVADIIKSLGYNIKHMGNLKAGYISGNSCIYKALSKIGSSPYNILIAEKTGSSIR